MYKVIIVDDEAISRIGIQGIIDWEEHGFKVIGLAVNGSEALELIEKEDPDIVFTDVKMPIMSGIELIAEAKKRELQTEFFVISAYDEFAYLKEAMKLGAQDYVIKNNLKPDIMIELLEKYKKNIKANEIKTNNNNTASIDSELLDEARKHFIKFLLYGKKNISEINESILEKYQLKLSKQNTLVMLIKGDNANDDDSMRMTYSIVEDLVQDHQGMYFCQTGYEEISILYSFDEPMQFSAKDYVRKIASRFSYVIKQYLNFNIKVYISSIFSGYEKIPNAYKQVCEIDQYFFSELEIGKPIFYDEIENNKTSIRDENIEKILRDIKTELERNNHEGIVLKMVRFIDCIKSVGALSRKQLQYYMSILLYMIQEHAVQRALFELEKLVSELKQNSQLESNTSIERYVEAVESLCETIEKIYRENEEHSKYVCQIKAYLQKNYTKKICLEDLAKKIGLSYAYMSTLYKKETGESIKDYLIDLRIKSAQKELVTTNLPIYTIAINSGYENEHYFSRLFKQRTGISPSAYRNNQK